MLTRYSLTLLRAYLLAQHVGPGILCNHTEGEPASLTYEIVYQPRFLIGSINILAIGCHVEVSLQHHTDYHQT